MSTMHTPGFTADTALYATKGRYQLVATRVYRPGHGEVVSQQLARSADSWTRASAVRNALGFGSVHCFTHCEGLEGSQTQFCREECYWWPS